MKVVITDNEYRNLDYEKRIFNNSNIDLFIENCKTEEDVISACEDADGIINLYAPITRKVIDSLKKCKVITRYGVGTDTINIEAATQKRICIANVPDYGVDEVSDHALTLIMTLLRKVNTSNQNVKKGKWNFNLSKPIHRVSTLTIGLIGFGNIPQRLSSKLKILGVRVIVSDPYLSKETAEKQSVTIVTPEELYREADLISIHAPLNESTKGMIGKREFQQMKEGIYIVNTARGQVIDEESFIEALSSGKVAGAGLDVIETEPIREDHPFLEMNHVILTPHIAGYSEESAFEMRSKAALGITDVLIREQYPKYLLNKKVKKKITLKEFENSSVYTF